MKNIFTLFIVTIFTTISFSQERNFNISITVKGMENQIGILANYYADKRMIKDTLKFDINGIATIKGKKNIPAGVYLVAFPSFRYNSFDVIIKETYFSIVTDTANFITKSVVKNSIENKQLFEDMNYMYPLGIQTDSLQKLSSKFKKTDSAYVKNQRAIEAIGKQITEHRKTIAKKYPTTLYSKLIKVMQDIDVPKNDLRNEKGALVDSFFAFHYSQQHYFDNVDFADSALVRSPVLHGKLMKYFEQYVFPSPDSIIKYVDIVISKARASREMYQLVLNELFSKYARSEIMGYDAIYVYMAEKYYLSGEAPWAEAKGLMELRDRVEAVKPTLLGKIAPNFTAQDTLGKNYTFHDFVPKNKYTLLVFWNSDCGHCQKEIPALKQLYTDSLKQLGVRLFTCSTEQTDSSFRTFVAKNCSPDWITCADMRGMSAFRKEYDLIVTPRLFLITPNYKILAKNIPLENLVDFIKFQDGLITKKEEK